MLALGPLRVFHAITRTGSFTKAAERLGVTPPAVSLQIRQLERHHGVRLFERVGRRVRLTPAGEVLEHYANRVFTLADDAERALQAGRGFVATRLRIAATPTTAGYYLGPFWQAVRRRYPDLRLELSVHNSRTVRERLLARDDDLGMLGGEFQHPDLVFRAFARDALLVIVAPDHPWARRRSVSLAALSGQPLILREPGSATRDVVERHLRAAGVVPGLTVEIASTEAIKRAVEVGTGVSVLAAAAVRRDVEAGHLHALRVSDPSFSVTMALAHHRDRSESPLVLAVLDAVTETRRDRGASRRGAVPRRSSPRRTGGR
jgi:DNA-binding transcriptional LysR family regulator